MDKQNFYDEVHHFQRFVKENIRLLGNYIVISEQLYMKNNETSIIDILAVNNTDRRLTVLELKNETTTDKNSWQPLRYYDLIKRGEDDIRQLLINSKHKFDYDINAINIDPKLVFVVPQCNEQLLRTLSYFENIDSEVIELSVHNNGIYSNVRKQIHKPTSIFHSDDLTKIKVDNIDREWNFEEYIRCGINNQKIELARRVSQQIKSLFNKKGYAFDIYFTKTKITIMKDGKVWGHLFIKQKSLDYKLTFSFKTPKDCVTNSIDFSYNPSIESFDIQKNGLKLEVNNILSSNLLEKYV